MAEKIRRLIRFPSVLNQVGLGRTSVYEKIKAGNFPKPIHIGARAVAFDSEAIDEWVEKTIEEGK
jgi:prophage regulatory protein